MLRFNSETDTNQVLKSHEGLSAIIGTDSVIE